MSNDNQVFPSVWKLLAMLAVITIGAIALFVGIALGTHALLR